MSDFKAKMHQNPKFGRGSAPCPAGGAYSAPPDLLAGFKGPTSKGRGGQGSRGDRRGEKGRDGKGGGDGMGGECCGVQKILKMSQGHQKVMFSYPSIHSIHLF